jgi:hypothetical protein
MIEFNPLDPYPHHLLGTFAYADAQSHSARVDAWLGLRADDIERALSEETSALPYEDRPSQQRWVGLGVQALLTPYIEFRAMLEYLKPKPGAQIADLGAGYGRMGLVLARHFPQTRFLGVECVEERVREGSRIFVAQAVPRDAVQLVVGDLSSPEFALPEADLYFMYDFGDRIAIEKTLQDLRALASRRPITVIGRGRGTRDAIERRHPWLSGIVEPENLGNFSVYRSA